MEAWAFDALTNGVCPDCGSGKNKLYIMRIDNNPGAIIKSVDMLQCTECKRVYTREGDA